MSAARPPAVLNHPSPSVTLVVATLNEAVAIERCLTSVLAQDYPPDRLEILVYDGGSIDGTADIASRVLASRPFAAVRPNPRRIQAAAWNLGVADAMGEIVGIMSGHAELDAGYVRAAVAALRRTGADMVGGPVRAVGDGRMAEAIALATSTVFGAGGARFRLTDRVEEVDTVFMGVSSREIFRRFPFDEEMVRNQDDELSYRMLDAGCRIVCDPAIGSSYRSRASLTGLARQYWAYGYWKVRVLQKHPAQTRVRHLVPPAFALAIAGGAALLPFHGAPRLAGSAVFLAYGTVNGVASISASRGRRDLLPMLPIVYLTLQAAYGCGFIRGVVRFRRGWPRGALMYLLSGIRGRATK